MNRSTKLPSPRGHWPAGPLVALALVLLALATLRFCTGCAELLPALTAAAPVAASGLDAYSRAVEAAKASGADQKTLTEIAAALARIEALEREQAAVCRAAPAPAPADPGALAKALERQAQLEEQLALERAVAAELLRRIPRAGGPGGGAP